MKDVLNILTIAAAALAVVALATFGAGDRQTLVPPPDAVAETFARNIVEERYALAVKCLSRELRRKASPESLRKEYSMLQSMLGQTNAIDAQLDAIKGDEAAARAIVEAERGSAVLSFRFVREQGLWKLTALPSAAAALTARGH